MWIQYFIALLPISCLGFYPKNAATINKVPILEAKGLRMLIWKTVSTLSTKTTLYQRDFPEQPRFICSFGSLHVGRCHRLKNGMKLSKKSFFQMFSNHNLSKSHFKLCDTVLFVSFECHFCCVKKPFGFLVSFTVIFLQIYTFSSFFTLSFYHLCFDFFEPIISFIR